MATSTSPVAIVGAGPTGIACAIELSYRGIEAVCYDKGFLLDTIYHFPEEMRWFSTRDLLDIAGIPFAVPDAHPTRLESLAYYRAVAEKFQVKVVPHTEIISIRPGEGGGVVVILSDSSSEARRRHSGSGASATLAKEAAKDPPSSVETEARELSVPAAIIATGFFH